MSRLAAPTVGAEKAVSDASRSFLPPKPDAPATSAADAPGATPAPVKRKMFRNKFTLVRLPPEAVERQSRITLLAWNRLGPDGAKVFLNSTCDALAGRPLDIAGASVDGYMAVERELATRAASAPQP